MPTLQPWLQSSADPTEVSNTVKGFIVSISSLIIFAFAQMFHVTLTADNIISLATDVGMLAGGIWFIYGLIMKGAIKVGSVKNPRI